MDIRELAAQATGQHQTMPAFVTGVLREAILSGALHAGEPLRQEEIADSFGISRIPVREALLQLEGEGLVKAVPHRGAVVAEFSLDELRELCDIRVALETAAIQLAVPHLTQEDLALAESVVCRADALDEETKPSEWGANNWEFHSTLYAPANRPRLLALIRNLHVHFDRYVRVYHSLMNFTSEAQVSHRQIVEACRQGDVEGAAARVERDIVSVIETVIGSLQRADQQ